MAAILIVACALINKWKPPYRYQ